MTATVKLRGKVNFPATVTAEGGFQIVKANGVWTLSPKWDDLALETTIPDPEARQLWTLDPVNNVYARLSVQALIDNLPEGPPGDPGAPGATGPSPGIHQAYSTTTTDADPGAGTFRLNNATPASATAAYLDNVDAAGATVSGIIDRWDDSTNTVKGFLRVEKSGDATVWGEWNVTGSVVDGTGYRKLTLASGAGSGTFTNADVFAITFTRAGDKGADGVGTGDVVGPASATNNSLARFDGTTGKLLKDGAVVGVDVQAYDADLATLAALGNWKVVYSNGSSAVVALTLGADATIFASNGATSAPTFRSIDNLGGVVKSGNQALTGGFTSASVSAGTKSSGTYTFDPTAGAVQHATNGGAHTFAPPATMGAWMLDYVNNGSAGAITTSGWTKVDGDSFTTTNTHAFRCMISVGNQGSYLSVKRMV